MLTKKSNLNVLAQRWISSWPRFFLAMLIGGLFGYLVSMLNQPLYQGSALIQISIDQNRASVPDDITVRQAYDRIRLVILADDTLNATLELYAVSGVNTGDVPTLPEFRSMIKLAQRFNAFELVVSSADPEQASSLANFWGEVALREIEAATSYTLLAGAYQSALYEASCVISIEDGGSDPQAIWQCASDRADVDPESLSAGILEAVKQVAESSRYFPSPGQTGPRSRYSSSDAADGWLVLAGSVLGLIGLVLIELFRMNTIESMS